MQWNHVVFTLSRIKKYDGCRICVEVSFSYKRSAFSYTANGNDILMSCQ